MPAFIYSAARTVFGRLGGALAEVRPDDLSAAALTGLATKTPALDPSDVDEVVWGNANGAGEENRNVGRMALLLAGWPVSVPATTVNRLCGSSLDAAIIASRAVEPGDADLVVAGGAESMTRAPWVLPKPGKGYPASDVTAVSTTLGWRLVNSRMPAEWTVSLGECKEQLQQKFSISRERQDAFAVRSHRLADRAWQQGRYDDLVVPVPGADLARDESIRASSTPDKLATLKPAFRPDGTITAGNASSLNDGASAVLIGADRAARTVGSDPLARIAGRRAFALGHPLGASGGRILGTLAPPADRRTAAVGRRRHLHRRRPGAGRRPGKCQQRRGFGMRTQVFEDADAAVAGIADGSTVLIGGFGMAGMPVVLIDALIRQGATDLTVVSNNAGNGNTGLAALLAAGRVRKMICSFPRQHDSHVFDGLYRSGRVELELVPQGNLAERMRAAGAGIGAFFCPTGVGTPLAEGKETRTIDGRNYVLEYPIRGDVALIAAHKADRLGNLVYRKTARNFGPVMATAAATTIVQVSEVVDVGGIDPEAVVTPGIFVNRILDLAEASGSSAGKDQAA